MRIRFAGKGMLPLLLSLAALSAAQTGEQPPVKMGLWQSEVSTTMTGMPSGSNAKESHTTVKQSCLTVDSWKRDLAEMQKHDDSDCTRTNMRQDAHGVTFEESCKSDRYSSTIHFEMLFDSGEHMHGTAVMKMTGPSFPQGMTMNMTMASHFLSANCGSVKPGDEKTLKE